MFTAFWFGVLTNVLLALAAFFALVMQVVLGELGCLIVADWSILISGTNKSYVCCEASPATQSSEPEENPL